MTANISAEVLRKSIVIKDIPKEIYDIIMDNPKVFKGYTENSIIVIKGEIDTDGI